MRVLVAFDKFKDALSAPQACSAAAEELRRLIPGVSVDECPLADAVAAAQDAGRKYVTIASRVLSGK